MESVLRVTHGGKVEGIAIPTDGTNCFVQGTENNGWDNCGGSWINKVKLKVKSTEVKP